MQYKETGRVFTLALRTIDAEFTSVPGQACFLTWREVMKDLLPPDISPSSTFRVHYKFTESTYKGSFVQCGNSLCDNVGLHYRQKMVFCTLAQVNQSTNVNGLLDAGAGFSSTPQGLQAGFIGTLDCPRIDGCHANFTPARTSAWDTTAAAGGLAAGFNNSQITPVGSMSCPINLYPKRTSEAVFLCSKCNHNISIVYRDNTQDPRTSTDTATYLVADIATGNIHNGWFKYSSTPVFPTSPFFPVFWSVTRTFTVQPAQVYDALAPLGTHVFEFHLLLPVHS